jgi:hypothetical protein
MNRPILLSTSDEYGMEQEDRTAFLLQLAVRFTGLEGCACKITAGTNGIP